MVRVHGSGRATLRNRKFLRRYTPIQPSNEYAYNLDKLRSQRRNSHQRKPHRQDHLQQEHLQSWNQQTQQRCQTYQQITRQQHKERHQTVRDRQKHRDQHQNRHRSQHPHLPYEDRPDPECSIYPTSTSRCSTTYLMFMSVIAL